MNINKFLLFDGSMGTYYASKNRPYNHSQANLLDYNTIVSIHREYINSGAMAITTNTFGVEDLSSIRAAVNAAQDAVRDTDTLIFGSIGPINGYEATEYMPIIDTLINNGITNFVFETFATEDVIVELANYIKGKLHNSFIITSFAVDHNGYTAYGKFYNDIISRVKLTLSIDSYGFNCVCGPVHMKELVAKLDTADILSIMPNAGYPSYVNNKPTYTDNPEYFAEKLYEIYQLGAKIIGGCCGTTPKHIELTRKLLDTSISEVIIEQSSKVNQPIPKIINRFKEQLNHNSAKVIIVEYDPPVNASGNDVTMAARIIEKAGADAISIADNPLGRARADSLLIASRIKRDTRGITVIPHMTCRDRNSISIRSALMGLNVEEINNLLCITGDPVPTCIYKQAKGVFSFNSTTLLSYVESINNELTTGNFYVGAALNVNANHYHLELERATKKVINGAKYFLTQPCFSENSINNALLAKELLKVPVIVGIMPIKSYKSASFINSEISGIDIPEDVIELFRDKNADECVEISISLCSSLIRKLYPYVNGFHLITPPNGEKIIVRLIEEIKKI